MGKDKRGKAASGVLRLIEGGLNDNTEYEREGVINLSEYRKRKEAERKREKAA